MLIMAAKIHSSTHHSTESSLLPRQNADGLPVIPMDDELKYRFDVKGWILLPALIPEDQLHAIRAHQLAFLYDRESLPPEQRDNHGGPSQVLLAPPDSADKIGLAGNCFRQIPDI